MNRSILTALALTVLTPVSAFASIDPEPLERDVALLTPAPQSQIDIDVAAEELDECRALLSAVLGRPPLGQYLKLGAQPTPSLPVVQCVVEARAE